MVSTLSRQSTWWGRSTTSTMRWYWGITPPRRCLSSTGLRWDGNLYLWPIHKCCRALAEMPRTTTCCSTWSRQKTRTCLSWCSTRCWSCMDPPLSNGPTQRVGLLQLLSSVDFLLLFPKVRQPCTWQWRRNILTWFSFCWKTQKSTQAQGWGRMGGPPCTRRQWEGRLSGSSSISSCPGLMSMLCKYQNLPHINTCFIGPTMPMPIWFLSIRVGGSGWTPLHGAIMEKDKATVKIISFTMLTVIISCKRCKL